jgi:hypothetical protein
MVFASKQHQSKKEDSNIFHTIIFGRIANLVPKYKGTHNIEIT